MARGGWRWGAGRPGWHVKAEHCLRLDVRDLARRQLIGSGTFSWTWRRSDTGEETGSITVHAYGQAAVTLFYQAGGETVRQEIELDRTRCYFGGGRPWFCCPLCGDRCAVLYLRGARFKCRSCAGAVYSSQGEDAMGRAWRRQQRLEAKLGPDWRRPKYMHRSTREAILARIFACEEERDIALAAHLRRLGLVTW